MVGTRRIVVTGATGTLGRHVVAALAARDAVVPRVVSRRPAPQDLPADREWAAADLVTDPLEPVVAGSDAIVHLASEKGNGTGDVEATRRLLDAADAAGVRHAVVISIIGCDRIALPFYESKRRIEEVVRAAGVGWSIVRVAQFHSFVHRLVSAPAALPLPTPIIADLRFQPVDEREAAEHLVDVALGPARGIAPEIAGPEVLTLGEIAAAWLDRTGAPASLLPIGLDTLADDRHRPGPEPAGWAIEALRGYQAAANTPRGERLLGTVRFVDWLRRPDRG